MITGRKFAGARHFYTPQEWRDACEVIAWIAAQDWCSGSVGLIGISWSGFKALQIAACSTDDRYADDMHYMGGALLNDNLQYGATLFTWTPPPDPAIVGDRWKAMWLARLNEMDPPSAPAMCSTRVIGRRNAAGPPPTSGRARCIWRPVGYRTRQHNLPEP